MLVKDTNWKKVQVRPYCYIYPVHDTSWFHAIKKYYRNKHWNHKRMILKFLVNEGRLRCGPLICLLCFKCTKSDHKVPCDECVDSYMMVFFSPFCLNQSLKQRAPSLKLSSNKSYRCGIFIQCKKKKQTEKLTSSEH